MLINNSVGLRMEFQRHTYVYVHGNEGCSGRLPVLCTPPHCLAGLRLDSEVQWTFNGLYYIWQLEQFLSNFLVGVQWTSGRLWTNYCCWLGFRLGFVLGFGFRLG